MNVVDTISSVARGDAVQALYVSVGRNPSFNRTVWITVWATGEVKAVDTTRDGPPALVGRVAAGDVQALAKTLIDVGFPNLALPPGTPPAPPTVPPVQLEVRGAGPDERAGVSVPASRLDQVPGLKKVVDAVLALEAKARKGQ